MFVNRLAYAWLAAFSPRPHTIDFPNNILKYKENKLTFLEYVVGKINLQALPNQLI